MRVLNLKADEMGSYGIVLDHRNNGGGVNIMRIAAMSPASFADLKVGQKIVDINGHDVSNSNPGQIMNMMRAFNKQIRITVDECLHTNPDEIGKRKIETEDNESTKFLRPSEIECYTCGKTFNQYSQLRWHIENDHCDTKVPHTDLTAPKIVAAPFPLQVSGTLASNESETVEIDTNPTQDKEIENVDSDDGSDDSDSGDEVKAKRKLKCLQPGCKQLNVDYSLMLRHYRFRHGGIMKESFSCKSCGTSITFDNLKVVNSHIGSHFKSSALRSSMRKKDFIEKNRILNSNDAGIVENVHYKYATITADYICEHCLKTYYDKKRLDKHKEKWHTENKILYLCNICNSGKHLAAKKSYRHLKALHAQYRFDDVMQLVLISNPRFKAKPFIANNPIDTVPVSKPSIVVQAKSNNSDIDLLTLKTVKPVGGDEAEKSDQDNWKGEQSSDEEGFTIEF